MTRRQGEIGQGGKAGRRAGRRGTALAGAAVAVTLLGSVLLPQTAAATTDAGKKAGGGTKMPAVIDGGAWDAGHVQGMALDRKGGYMYFSFTNLLVKTDLRGNPVGSVTGFTGHLGDLDFDERDGRVYGSLEYKDAESFYIAAFDADRIDRMGIDAQTSDIVSTVYLKEVVADYTADMDGNGVFDGDTADTRDHRYGCSGIDGVVFGPDLGGRGGRHHGTPLLTVAYGIYSNNARHDNDHQVLLQYDVRRWKKYERPLSESAPHTSGPAHADGKYFAYTGNTTYGVQNLEYDAASHNWQMAVYEGKKPDFPNYSLFTIDGTKPAVRGPVRGQPEPEQGRLLTLARQGLYDPVTGVRGWQAPGEYGLVSLDDGLYYVAESGTVEEDGATKQTGRAVLHRWTGRTPNPLAPVRESTR
ncbi:hypothetical protein ITI46_06385 [Streptomyces oryzae]|uniref:Uncharacterized protein n=1 Tax=Streptomyces oryzae TaxID=1434886 RepID=A0ABS3X7J1_9ACTN|nr:hypothetical protein [Streptomyces oryzae]